MAPRKFGTLDKQHLNAEKQNGGAKEQTGCKERFNRHRGFFYGANIVNVTK